MDLLEKEIIPSTPKPEAESRNMAPEAHAVSVNCYFELFRLVDTTFFEYLNKK